MDNRGASSLLLPMAGLGSLLLATAYHAEGAAGFRPFLNLEAILLVAGGTWACLQMAYPVREVLSVVASTLGGLAAGDDEEARRWAAILRHGADSALAMGGAATLFGLILMLSGIDDVSALPRRMALALVALFYGLILSEGFFMPLARRVRGPSLRLTLPEVGRRRFLVGLSAGAGTVTSFFVILYALSASSN